MTPFGPWAGLPPELLLLVSNGFDLSLESYCRLRSVCTSWRSALPPPTPSLLTCRTMPDDPLHQAEPPQQVSAFVLPAATSFHVGTLPHRVQIVGSTNGWMAVAACTQSQTRISLCNFLAGGSSKEIRLPTLRKRDKTTVRKLVFASKPNPTRAGHVAVAICGLRSLAYARARYKEWSLVDVNINLGDHLLDLAYVDADDDDDGKAYYCVTIYGGVHVLRLPNRRRRNPVVERLQLGRADVTFDPATVYAPPYDATSKYMGLKRIFVVGGSVYQLWCNTTSIVSWEMPGRGRFRIGRDQAFVLKYDPERRPCWDAASDLGGHAVFVGKNNPMVLRPEEDAAGVRANCVYWIDEWSKNAPMVFDVVARTSSLHPSAAKALSLTPSCRPVCWYFLNDKVMVSSKDGERKRVMNEDDCGVQVSKSQKTC